MGLEKGGGGGEEGEIGSPKEGGSISSLLEFSEEESWGRNGAVEGFFNARESDRC